MSKEDRREYNRIWATKNRDKEQEKVRFREWYYSAAGEDYRTRNNAKINARVAMRYRNLTPQQIAANNKRIATYKRNLRIKCLQHYSHGAMSCACCGEANIEFLALDHINGGGNKERKMSGRKGTIGLAQYLIKNGFPDGYRVLCHNCNQSLGAYKYCPHLR